MAESLANRFVSLRSCKIAKAFFIYLKTSSCQMPNDYSQMEVWTPCRCCLYWVFKFTVLHFIGRIDSNIIHIYQSEFKLIQHCSCLFLANPLLSAPGTSIHRWGGPIIIGFLMNCCDCRILFISNTKCNVEEVSCLTNCFPETLFRWRVGVRN